MPDKYDEAALTLLRDAHSSGCMPDICRLPTYESCGCLSDISNALRKAVMAEREACAKIADRYGDTPVGDERQDALEAFKAGMNYRTGGTDNAMAIEEAIRNRGDDDLTLLEAEWPSPPGPHEWALRKGDDDD